MGRVLMLDQDHYVLVGFVALITFVVVISFTVNAELVLSYIMFNI